ncbi:energy-coupling factor ABC transporter ATP-binding protein [Fervidobacterium islandicum]|uniref:energy-coupling factor ABC transporter ATP-binding protein n=1 Tax=Fervidobacterium islandicum TaxID=2423 RepID=UPI003A62035D
MLIELKEVSVIFEEDTDVERVALREINLSFSSNESILLVGNTGSGKTTLIYLIDLLIKPSRGSLSYDGKDPFLYPYEYRKKFGVAFQIPERQFFSEMVEQELTYAAKNFQVPFTQNDIEEVLELVGLRKSVLKESPFRLSGGEQRKVAIASILLHKPEFLIFDEPTAGLDLQGVLSVREILKKFKQNGKGFLIATHEPELFEDLCDRKVVLHKGTIFEDLRLSTTRAKGW